MTGHDFPTLLADPRRSGIYNLPAQGADPIVKAAQAAGFAVFHVPLGQVTGKDALLSALASAMQFPEWFGGNWDALADCLADLSWVNAPGFVVLLEDCDTFASADRADFATAADILKTTADLWREDGIPFWTFADLHPNGLALLPSLT